MIFPGHFYAYDTINDLDTLLYQKKFNEWTDDYRTLYDLMMIIITDLDP
jgi:hypothetical protein